MRFAITGGAGFVGRHFARGGGGEGDEVVLIARGMDRREESIFQMPHAKVCAIGVSDVGKLAEAMKGCEAIAHCAGINREIGEQTYERVHVEGTRNVVEAVRRAGVKK